MHGLSRPGLSRPYHHCPATTSRATTPHTFHHGLSRLCIHPGYHTRAITLHQYTYIGLSHPLLVIRTFVVFHFTGFYATLLLHHHRAPHATTYSTTQTVLTVAKHGQHLTLNTLSAGAAVGSFRGQKGRTAPQGVVQHARIMRTTVVLAPQFARPTRHSYTAAARRRWPVGETALVKFLVVVRVLIDTLHCRRYCCCYAWVYRV